MQAFAVVVAAVLASMSCAQEQAPKPAPAPGPVVGGPVDIKGWPEVGASVELIGSRQRRRVRLPADVARAIASGLQWLQTAQDEDGRWTAPGGDDATVAVTSLAALAMLGDGTTMRAGPYKNPLKLATAWLRNRQAEDGAFAEQTGPHLLATCVMAENVVLSSYRLLKPNTDKGLTHLRRRRLGSGAFAAVAGSADVDPSLLLWGITALEAARVAGFKAPLEAEATIAWLCGDEATRIVDRSVLGVVAPPVRQPELAFDQLLANALTGFWLGLAPQDNPHLQAARRRALDPKRAWVATPGSRLSMHEWFCSAYLLQRCDDDEAAAAATALAAALVAAQVTDGDNAGSWEPIGVFGEAGGRAWTTALAVLTLEAPVRYEFGGE